MLKKKLLIPISPSVERKIETHVYIFIILNLIKFTEFWSLNLTENTSSKETNDLRKIIRYTFVESNKNTC